MYMRVAGAEQEGKGRESKSKARAIFCQRAEAEIPKQPSAAPAASSFWKLMHVLTVDKLEAHALYLSLTLP